MKIRLEQTYNWGRITGIIREDSLFKRMVDDGGDSARWNPAYGAGDIYLAAVDVTTKKDIGLVILESFTRISFKAHIAVLPEYQGKFVSFKIARAAIDWAGRVKGVYRFVIMIPEHSLPARRVAERLGFQQVGLVPAVVSFNDVVQGICVYHYSSTIEPTETS